MAVCCVQNIVSEQMNISDYGMLWVLSGEATGGKKNIPVYKIQDTMEWTYGVNDWYKDIWH